MTRYSYSTHSTKDRAETALEEEFALGNVSEAERPRIEPVRDHRQHVIAYQITLEG